MALQAKRSIGQILPLLKDDFPDISISKIRYLESEGLLAPERAPSGYRKYSDDDVKRLRYILTMQRDHYLPLKVIRENLDLIDQGIEPPTVETPAPQASETVEPASAPSAPAEEQQSSTKKRPMKLTRRELLKVSGIPEATLIELERQKMIQPRPGSMYYGREALTLCVVARKLRAYGMDTRHLRAIQQAAQREAGLIEQAAAPHRGSRAEARKTVNEISQLVVHAHAAMLHTLLDRS